MTASRKIAAAVAATAVAGAVVAGTGAAQAAVSPAAASKAVPTCAAAGLRVLLGGWLAGGMMHQGAMLRLTNTTRWTCALRGYPGVGMEDAHHRVLTTRTHWGSTWYATDPGRATLYLRPGQTAEANIAWTHANEGTSGAVKAAYLEVTPPASRVHKVIAFNEWVDFGRLDVTALAYRITVR